MLDIAHKDHISFKCYTWFVSFAQADVYISDLLMQYSDRLVLYWHMLISAVKHMSAAGAHVSHHVPHHE